MKGFSRLVVVTTAALSLWFSATGNAAAHTMLTDSTPANGATVQVPPVELALAFNEDINANFANVVINDAGGRNWASGSPQVTGSRIRVALSPELPGGGEYTAAYRVVSADGHPVSGSITFTVAGSPGSSKAPAPASLSATPAASPEPDAPLGTDSKGSIIIAGVVGLLLGGLIVLWQARRRRNRAIEDEPLA